jgi:hypothetical protein
MVINVSVTVRIGEAKPKRREYKYLTFAKGEVT